MDTETIRTHFPVTANYAYFNNAAIGPLSLPAATAMQAQAEVALRQGVHGYSGWLDDYAGVRDETAAMLGCSAEEVAITKNTSEGLCAIANGLDWRSGDTVVGLSSDFPANYVPWRELQGRRGVRFRSLELRGGRLELEDLDQACKGARLAALSYVHFLTGFRWDLAAVGEICRRRGCLLVLDAVQGMGAFPIDVKACGVHALSASGHKWLLGPEGCGVLYIDREVMSQVVPVEFGWTSLEGFEEYRHDGDLQPGARRYECGTLNSVGCAGLRASLALLNQIGPEVASRHIDTLVDRLLAGVLGKGYEVAAERTSESGSGILSMRKCGADSGATARALVEHRVSVAERMGWIRVAPHVYNTAQEIDRLVELLP
jgi:selenocysteine lyase/cysteine desulfurase